MAQGFVDLDALEQKALDTEPDTQVRPDPEPAPTIELTPNQQMRSALVDSYRVDSEAYGAALSSGTNVPPMAAASMQDDDVEAEVQSNLERIQRRPGLLSAFLEDLSLAPTIGPKGWKMAADAVDSFDPFVMINRTREASGDQVSGNVDLVEGSFRALAPISDALFGTELNSLANESRIDELEMSRQLKQQSLEGLTIPEQSIAFGTGMIPFTLTMLTARGIGASTFLIPYVGPAVGPVATVALPVVAAGVIEGGAFYNSTVRQFPDMDPSDVAVMSLVVGAINGALEQVPFDAAISNLTGAARRQAVRLLADRKFRETALFALKRLAIQSGSEGLTEFLQEIGPVAGELALQYARGDITAEEMFQGMVSPEAMARYGESAYLGFLGAPVIGGVTIAGGLVAERSNVAAAQARRAVFQDIADTSKNNAELIDRIPQRYRQLVDDATQADGQVEGVYVTPEVLLQAYPVGSPEYQKLVSDVGDLSARIGLAQNTGGKVRFSRGEFATFVAGSAQFDALGDHLSFAEDQPSLAESLEFSSPENVARLRERLAALRDSLETDPVRDRDLEADFALNLESIFAETMPAVAAPVREKSARIFARSLTRIAEMDGQEPLELFSDILDRVGFEQRPELDSAAEIERTNRIFDGAQRVERPSQDRGPATVGEARTVFDLDGNPVEAEVVAVSEAGTVIARLSDGSEVLLDNDPYLDRDPRSPQFEIDAGVGGQDGRRVSDLSDAELEALTARLEEVAGEQAQAGLEGTPTGVGTRANLTAAQAEQERRAGVPGEVGQDVFKQAADTGTPANQAGFQEQHLLNVQREARERGQRISWKKGEQARIKADAKKVAAKLAKIERKKKQSKADQAFLKKHGGKTVEEIQASIEAYVRDRKLAHPAKSGWVPWVYDKTKIEPNGKLTHMPVVVPYSFDRAANGRALQGKERERVIRLLARKARDAVMDVYIRAQNGDREARVILRQADWYRELRSRLRREFGGLGDLMADLLGATSPNTPVRLNWESSVEALRLASRGDFDELIDKWEAWADALDAAEDELEQWIAEQVATGRTKKEIKGTKEYQNRKAAVARKRKLPDNLRPRKANGALFGFNGRNVARAMVDLWRVIKVANSDIGRGTTAPKAVNFSGNLIGYRERATIDVWAARFLQRLRHSNQIPSAAETGVAGFMLPDGSTSGQFRFGQDAFSAAVELIKADPVLGQDRDLSRIADDDFQALVWFIEKEIWAKKSFTSAEGEGGSFEFEADLTGSNQVDRIKELRKVINSSKSSAEDKAEASAELDALKRTVDRFVGGLSLETSGEIQGDAFVPNDGEMAVVSTRMKDALYASDPDAQVVGSKFASTIGRYGADERAFDIEVVAKEDFDPGPFFRQMVEEARAANQDAVFLSRVLTSDEQVDESRHRPGIEVYFRESAPLSEIEDVLAKIKAIVPNGFTVVVDGRRSERFRDGQMPNVVGVRAQLIPEFEARYGDESWQGLDEAGLRAKVQATAKAMRLQTDQILADVEGVTFCGIMWHETDVRFREEYDAFLGGGSENADATRAGRGSDQGAGRGRFGRTLAEGIEAATGRAGSEGVQAQPGVVAADGDQSAAAPAEPAEPAAPAGVERFRQRRGGVIRDLRDRAVEWFRQPGFHGSPHRFDKFDLTKIGTGEGAQAFGWGLYFSSSRGIAEFYRETLLGRARGGEVEQVFPVAAKAFGVDFQSRMQGLFFDEQVVEPIHESTLDRIEEAAIDLEDAQGDPVAVEELENRINDLVLEAILYAASYLNTGMRTQYSDGLPRDVDNAALLAAVKLEFERWLQVNGDQAQDAGAYLAALDMLETLDEGDIEIASTFGTSPPFFFPSRQRDQITSRLGDFSIENVPAEQVRDYFSELDFSDLAELLEEFGFDAEEASEDPAFGHSDLVDEAQQMDRQAGGAISRQFVTEYPDIVGDILGYGTPEKVLSDVENALEFLATEVDSADELATRIRDSLEGRDNLLDATNIDEQIWSVVAGALEDMTPDEQIPYFQYAKSRGQVYKVELPGPDSLLDWNKTLDQQPQAVQDALREIFEAEPIDLAARLEAMDTPEIADLIRAIDRNADVEPGDFFPGEWDQMMVADSGDAEAQYRAALEEVAFSLDDDGSLTEYLNEQLLPSAQRGEGIYLQLAARLGSQRAASEALAAKGVLGHRYDSGTLAGAKGKHDNFVIYDDNAIQVVEKYYQEQQGGTRGQLVLDRAIQKFMLQISESEVNDSTLIHELAHLTLEIVLDVAAGPDASEEIRAYAQDALNFLGVTDRSQIGTEQHERWAESWELYLSRGEAPTQELQGLFSFFMARLKAVYRTIREQLRFADHDLAFVPIFDRLLASEDEIRQSAARNPVTSPLLNASAFDLMTDDERERIERAVTEAQAAERRKLEATIERETRRELKVLQGELRDRITREVMARPEQRLRHWLRTGRTPVGEPIRVFVAGSETERHKLDRAKLAAYGADWRDLPRGTTATERALDPALVAAATGYDTPEDMIEALERAGDPRVEITRLVREEAVRQGILPTDEELRDMASEAVDGAQRDRLYEAQRAVAKAIRGRQELAQAETRAQEGQPAPTAGEAARRVQEAKSALDSAIARQAPQEEITLLQVELGRAQAASQVGKQARRDQGALRREVGAVERMPTRVLRATAASLVADTQVSELKRAVRDWKRLRTKASAAQTDAVLARDFDALENAIGQEQLANALAEEGAKRLEDVRSWRNFLTSFDRKGSKKRARLLKHANVEPMVEGGNPTNIMEVIDGLLDMVDFRNTSMRKIQNAATIREFARQIEEDHGIQIPLPTWVHRFAETPNYQTMKIGELEELYTTVKALEHHGLEMAREAEGSEASQRQAQIDELRGALQEQTPTVWADRISLGKARGIANFHRKVSGLVGSNMSIESLADILDDNRPEGPWNRLIVQPLQAAAQLEKRLRKMVEDPITAAWDRYSPSEKREFRSKKIFINAIGEGLTKEEILGIAAHMGNEHNRAALRDAKVYGLDDAGLEEVLSHVTEKDADYLVAVAESIDKLWPEASAAEKRINGVVPPKVEGDPWQLPSGRWMPGFYFPLDFNPDLNERSYEYKQREIGKGLMPPGGGSAMTKAGAMNQRKATSGGLTVNVQFHSVISKHVSSMARDIAYRGELIRLNRLVRALEGDIKRVVGLEMYREFRSFIKRMSTPIRPSDEWVPHWIVQVAKHSRIGLGMSVMAWRFTQAAIQFSGFMTAVHRVGAANMAHGFAEVYATGNPWENIKRYREMIPSLEDRASTFDRDAQRNSMRISDGPLSDAQRFSMHYGYYLLGAVDTFSSTAVAAAAFRQAMAGQVESVPANDTAAAIRYADKVIRRTQGSGAQIDQPAVLDAGELIKLVTPMMTYANTQFQQAIVEGTLAHRELQEMRAGLRAKGVPKQTARFLAFWTFAFIVEPLLSEGLRFGIKYATEPEPPDEEEFFLKVATRAVLGPLGGVPIAREIESAVNGFSPGGTPLEDLVTTYWQAALQTGRLVTFSDEFDHERLVRAYAKGVTYATGAPTKQMVDAWEVLTQEAFGRGKR
jgi:hypothetical protein